MTTPLTEAELKWCERWLDQTWFNPGDREKFRRLIAAAREGIAARKITGMQFVYTPPSNVVPDASRHEGVKCEPSGNQNPNGLQPPSSDESERSTRRVEFLKGCEQWLRDEGVSSVRTTDRHSREPYIAQPSEGEYERNVLSPSEPLAAPSSEEGNEQRHQDISAGNDSGLRDNGTPGANTSDAPPTLEAQEEGESRVMRSARLAARRVSMWSPEKQAYARRISQPSEAIAETTHKTELCAEGDNQPCPSDAIAEESEIGELVKKLKRPIELDAYYVVGVQGSTIQMHASAFNRLKENQKQAASTILDLQNAVIRREDHRLKQDDVIRAIRKRELETQAALAKAQARCQELENELNEWRAKACATTAT